MINMLYRIPYPNIMSVGVELEGGISERALRYIEEKYWYTGRLDHGYDSSVDVDPPDTSYNWIYNVEIKFWSEDMSELLNFVKDLFINGFRQNSTCGNHHHIIFKNHPVVVTAFSNPTAVKAFIRRYEKFAKQMQNLYGTEKYIRRLNNNYCKKPRNNYELYRNIVGYERYYAVNFRSLLWHRTLEIRILPHARNYVEFERMHLWLCRTLNSLVDTLLKKTDKLVTVEVSI